MHRNLLAIAGLLAVTAVAGARPSWDKLDGYTFERYTADHHKAYPLAEYEERRATFGRSLARVQAHNADPASSYKLGVNHLSDRTAAELAHMNGYKAMPSVQKKLRAQAHVRTHVVSGAPIPAQVDYRKSVPAVLTAVKNQGQCGSCWAHSATETLEAHWAIATGDLFVLSQQQLASCSPNPKGCGGTGGCEGSVPEVAYEALIKNKDFVASTWNYPYESFSGTDFQCKMGPNSTMGTEVHIDGYYTVPANDQTAVLDALAHAGPLSVVVDASGWSAYDTGIFDGCAYSKGNVSLDHVVQLVGYGHDEDLNKAYWIVRNSWGPAWGEHGFIRLIRYPEGEHCGWNTNTNDCRPAPGGVQRICGQCGLFFDVLYPFVDTKTAAGQTATLMVPDNRTATTCDGPSHNITLALEKCTGAGATSMWAAVTKTPQTLAHVDVFFSFGANASCTGDGAEKYVTCDKPFKASFFSESFSVISGCNDAVRVFKSGCNAEGANCTSTDANVVTGKCYKAGAQNSLELLGVESVRTLTQSVFKYSNCSGPIEQAATVPCDTCTRHGLLVC